MLHQFYTQAWKQAGEKWLVERSAAAEASIEKHIKASLLKEFLLISGKWDLESLRLSLTRLVTEIKNAATHMAD